MAVNISIRLNRGDTTCLWSSVKISDPLLEFVNSLFRVFLLRLVPVLDRLKVHPVDSIRRIHVLALAQCSHGVPIILTLVRVALKVDEVIVLLLVSERLDIMHSCGLQVAEVANVK